MHQTIISNLVDRILLKGPCSPLRETAVLYTLPLSDTKAIFYAQRQFPTHQKFLLLNTELKPISKKV